MKLLFDILLVVLVLFKTVSCFLMKKVSSAIIKRWIILLNPIITILFLCGVWFVNNSSVSKCLPITMSLIMLEVILQIVINVINYCSKKDEK